MQMHGLHQEESQASRRTAQAAIETLSLGDGNAAPALIDPPFGGSLDDWLKFRAEMEELRRSVSDVVASRSPWHVRLLSKTRRASRIGRFVPISDIT
jgi:hypothetical protein